ncbi:glycosyltransferase family 4 protein [Psychrobacter sp. M13]|uniref:glycosyltransferase family 4 protein n=1 Tax=Psychrobacter sp. M13 TaxID=3067275 RepID=UPI00273BA83A|nr:glycosyltransferase family 4 protein [Psychrobacter sp. M13]WLP95228.1 glycosyltransferase family 4 protein [Psychrobacter sp. M13]
MKFLVIASHPVSVLKFRGHLIQALKNKGCEIHIATPLLKSYPKVSKELKSLGYITHNIPMQRTGTNPLADAKTLKSLYTLMRDIKPTYVLAYTIKPVIYGTLAAWAAKVPHRFALITGLGYAFQQVEETGKRNYFQKIIHELYRQALSKTDKVFFQNPDDLNLFKQLKLISNKTPTTIVNGSGVDTSEYNIAPLPVSNKQPEIRFLLIARLLADKGIREYANAAKIIKNKYPEVNFDLVGLIDSNPTAISQQELDEWVDQGLLNFWGRLDDVRPAIAASSIYVLPSYREGTPRTVLEAMSMGRPVITTDAPGCRETVVDSYNGYLVPVKSVDGLVKAMEEFILNPELISTMGKASRKIAEDKFDVHSVNNIMINEMNL